MADDEKAETQQELGSPETDDQARERATKCGRELQEVLARHSCRLHLYIQQEAVGQDGRQLQTPRWAVIPNPLLR